MKLLPIALFFLFADPQTMCFKTGEERSGTYKVCYYNCLGSRVAITVKGYELCPLTIDR